MMTIKKYGIWLCLALTLLATYWSAIQENSGKDELLPVSPQSLSQKHIQSADLPSAAQAATTEPLIERAQINDVPVNLFSVLVPPQALVANESLVEVRQMPANPYSYAGKVVENGQVMVFLTDGTNNHVVKTGDVIDGLWEVEVIRPPKLILKYVPLRTEAKTEISIEIGVLS